MIEWVVAFCVGLLFILGGEWWTWAARRTANYHFPKNPRMGGFAMFHKWRQQEVVAGRLRLIGLLVSISSAGYLLFHLL